MAVNKQSLLSARTVEHEVEIPGVGTVKVRALTREEALAVRNQEMTVAEMEQKLLAAAMLEPQLTVKEVAMWQRNSPAGELEPVVNKIVEISGLAVEAAKEAMKTFRG
jgi:hypothetical protein